MKKILISVMALAVVFIFVACADSATNTQQEGTTVAVTDSTTKPEVSIPTDSGIADSVFDDVSVPTDAVNGDSTMLPVLLLRLLKRMIPPRKASLLLKQQLLIPSPRI